MKKISLILLLLLILLSGCNSNNKPCDDIKDSDNPGEVDNPNEPIIKDLKYTVTYTVTYGGELSGESVQVVDKGSETKEVSVKSIDGYHFDKWSDGSLDKKRKETNVCANITLEAIFVKDTYEFPNLYLTVDSSKTITLDTYISCSVSLTNPNNRDDNLSDLTGKIKGRGNSTWNYDKKPYKIKLDKKADLLGLGKAKTWVLLANYMDYSEIRNYVSYSIADYISDNESFVTDFSYVNLYTNGEYTGLYLLCEQVEIKENRVDITDSLDSYDTGYLIEVDGRYPYTSDEIKEAVLDYNYFKLDNLSYVIKGPDFEGEGYSSLFCATIKSYMTSCFNAVKNKNWNNIKELIDVNSFVESYIFHELVGNVDAYWTSFYFYKDKGGKLFCGPVWDMDLTSGNMNHNYKAKDPKYLYVKERCTWFNNLLQISEFKTLVKNKLNEKYDGIKSIINNNCSYIKFYQKEFERDLTKWDPMNDYIWSVPDDILALTSWKANVNYVKDWLIESLDNLKNVYCK